MKKWLALALAMLLTVCCGCSSAPAKEAVADPPANVTLPQMDLTGPFIDELVTVKYGWRQIQELVDYDGTNAEFLEKYPVECKRKTAFGYRAMYLGDGEAAMAVINENNLDTRECYSMLLSGTRELFETLKVGDPLSAVQALDKNGNYSFESAKWDIVENFSWHATTDKYLVFIRYNTDLTIASIQVELL